MSSLHYKGDRDKESVHWAVPMQKMFDISENDPHRVLFGTAPLTERMRLVGPIKLRLFASSSSDDMDIFVTLRNIDANGKEVVNSGCYTSNYPISQGWLRASLRKIDNELSTEYKPSYLYNEVQKLEPDQIYPLDIEIWDSAMTIEAGNCLVLEIGSQDQSGCSLLMHTGKDRIWDADVTVYTGENFSTYLMLPLIWE
ncbi:CocE/NonD family hydrolase C-terminal non-catalytic domain-containing protein [Lacrimispora sp. 38-1]|uniref:CocE/NonD family hydrolase C-terminal non-catalytic domain-containing protein n=1 Tax=Lacrimispora sp. 38-1 TaxID=3125778 RepID=UPI003CF6828B